MLNKLFLLGNLETIGFYLCCLLYFDKMNITLILMHLLFIIIKELGICHIIFLEKYTNCKVPYTLKIVHKVDKKSELQKNYKFHRFKTAAYFPSIK